MKEIFVITYIILHLLVYLIKESHSEKTKNISETSNNETLIDDETDKIFNSSNVQYFHKEQLSSTENDGMIEKRSVSPINNLTSVPQYNGDLDINQLNITWTKPLNSCDPQYFNIEVTAIPSSDNYCKENFFDSYYENGNSSSIIVPKYPHIFYVQASCSYFIKLIAYCQDVVYTEELNCSLPICIGKSCKCTNLKPIIDYFEVEQISSNLLNISWKFNGNGNNRSDNITHISFSYRPVKDGKHIKHNLPYDLWIVEGLEKSTNNSYFTAPTDRFQSGISYDIEGRFRNIFSCSSSIEFKNFYFTTGNNQWIGILSIILVICTILSIVLVSFRKNLINLVKNILNNSNHSSVTNCGNIVLDVINPLYQQQPLIKNENINRDLKDPYEFSRNNLKLIKFLNGGEFGEVHLGKALNIAGKPGWTYVAVKKTKDIYQKSEVSDELLEEIDIYKKISNHPHIVSLLGYCTVDHPFLIIMEFVPCGSVKEYLMELREKWHVFRKRKITESESFTNETSECGYICPDSPGLPSSPIVGQSYQTSSTSKTEVTSLSNDESPNSHSPTALLYNFTMEYLLDHQELKKFSLQIAKGMAYLEKLGITHRDLAARNILIDEFKTLKITDFGLSRYGTYVVVNKIKLPVRWMAMESLKDFVFNNKTDVWSFAVVLWEIGTLGGLPYKEVPINLLHSHILSGKKLPRPQICSDKLYSLMLRCWSDDPDNRPTFEELVEIQNQENSNAYIDFGLLNPTYIFPPTE